MGDFLQVAFFGKPGWLLGISPKFGERNRSAAAFLAAWLFFGQRPLVKMFSRI